MRKIFESIKNSVKTKTGKESSTRILAYFLAVVVAIFCFVFIGIEIATAIVALKNTGAYLISNEIIIIFGSILAHQLTLLGINKTAETSQHNSTARNSVPEPVPVVPKPEPTKVEPPKPEITDDEELIDP